MHAMRPTTARLLALLLVFLVGLTLTLLLLSRDSSSSLEEVEPATDEPKATTSSAVPASSVWKVGDTWTVNVRQDSGAITPDGDRSVVDVPHRFEVTEAPTKEQDTWLVHVSQDGAEGPFAKGWNLRYEQQDDGTMLLELVSVGDEPPLEAELASIVLGPQFPYEVRYEAPPKDATISADKLLDRSELPPGQLPDGGSAGAAPPAEAPSSAPGGVPAPPA